LISRTFAGGHRLTNVRQNGADLTHAWRDRLSETPRRAQFERELAELGNGWSTNTWPEIAISGTPGARAWTNLMVSSPPTPGMNTSTTTTSNRARESASIPCAPS
jgi:hypothetical protein